MNHCTNMHQLYIAIGQIMRLPYEQNMHDHFRHDVPTYSNPIVTIVSSVLDSCCKEELWPRKKIRSEGPATRIFLAASEASSYVRNYALECGFFLQFSDI